MLLFVDRVEFRASPTHDKKASRRADLFARQMLNDGHKNRAVYFFRKLVTLGTSITGVLARYARDKPDKIFIVDHLQTSLCTRAYSNYYTGDLINIANAEFKCNRRDAKVIAVH